MAAGRPIVTNSGTDVGGIVSRERIGVAAGDSPQDMALAILEMLENPGLLESMGRRSRELAETRYSWDRLAEKLHRFYNEVLESSVSRGQSDVR
jgi:spore coat protein SA